MTSPLLCSLGHVASTANLISHGVAESRIREAVADGRVVRVRRGTYCCSHLDEDTTRAAAIGGAITCVSVLRRHGVWAGHSRDLHVQIPPTASLPRQIGIRLHREHPRFGAETRWKTNRAQALWRAIHCLDAENAIAAIESAIHENFLPLATIQRIEMHAPRRLQPLLLHRVTNSGSGNETIVRIRLIDAGHTVRPQAFVPGMGHGDLLVDECLGIDIDGRMWHGEDRFAVDRDRDLLAEGLGWHVLRLRTSHIFESWPHTLAVIERTVADARPGLDRRLGRTVIRFDDPYSNSL